MKLVKIGNVILNFDEVTCVRDRGGMGSSAPITVEFGRGPTLEILAHADGLRTWLAANLTDLTPTPSPSS